MPETAQNASFYYTVADKSSSVAARLNSATVVTASAIIVKSNNQSTDRLFDLYFTHINATN